MKTFRALIAEDVPHYASVDIVATDAFDAIERAHAFDLTGVPTDPDWHNAVSRRIVEVKCGDPSPGRQL